MYSIEIFGLLLGNPNSLKPLDVDAGDCSDHNLARMTTCIYPHTHIHMHPHTHLNKNTD